MDLKLIGTTVMGVAMSLTLANAETFETLNVNGKAALWGGLSFRSATYHQIDVKDETDGTIFNTTGYNNSKFNLSFDAKNFEFRTGNVGIGTAAHSNHKLAVEGDAYFEGNLVVNAINNQFHVSLTGNSGVGIKRTEDYELKTDYNTIASDVQGNRASLHFDASDYKFRKGNTFFEGKLAVGGRALFETDAMYVKGSTTIDIKEKNEYFGLQTSEATSLDIRLVEGADGQSYHQLYSDAMGKDNCTPLEVKTNLLKLNAGKTEMAYDLEVNGKITCHKEIEVSQLYSDNLNANQINAKDINVELNNAADYVFEENYDLKSLKEVESFVKENKHLPGVPSAAEISENGMSVSQMSNLLLEKVEELTLHMIQLQKENEALKAKVESLGK